MLRENTAPLEGFIIGDTHTVIEVLIPRPNHHPKLNRNVLLQKLKLKRDNSLRDAASLPFREQICDFI